MAYLLNGSIQIGDYNSFAGASGTSAYGAEPAGTTIATGASIGNLYGAGWGSWGWNQSDISLAAVSAGQSIRTGEWTNLRNILANVRTHQTGSVDVLTPSTAVLAAGHAIDAHVSTPPTSDAFDFPAVINLAVGNRFQMFAPTLFALTSMTRATAWGAGSGFIQGIFSVGFTDANAAGFFFNTGGYIQFGFSQPVTTTQDADWADAFTTRIGSVQFGAKSTKDTGSVPISTALGFYALTSVYQTVWQGFANGHVNAHYNGNSTTIEALVTGSVLNGRPGNTISFRVTCQDSHIGLGLDGVSAGTQCSISAVKDTTNLTTVPATPSGSITTGW